MRREPRCVQRVSLDRVCRPTLRFPPQGPPGRVPLLLRYYQSTTTSSRPSRRASLPSLGGTSVALAWFGSSTAECSAEAWSWSPGTSIRESPRRRQDLPSSWGISPKFLGNLDCPSARVLTDAGRTARTRPLRCSSVAPGPPGAEAPTIGLSTPNSMAFGLAVYASQDGLPRHYARLASGCWSGSTGRAFHPQDSDERFQICFLHLILLSQASWRNGGDLHHEAGLARRQLTPPNGWCFATPPETHEQGPLRCRLRCTPAVHSALSVASSFSTAEATNKASSNTDTESVADERSLSSHWPWRSKRGCRRG